MQHVQDHKAYVREKLIEMSPILSGEAPMRRISLQVSMAAVMVWSAFLKVIEK